MNTRFLPHVNEFSSAATAVEKKGGPLCDLSHRLFLYLGFTLLAVCTNFLIDKEIGWDVLNYHLYSGFSTLNDRFAQDYFAAGPQSYLDPYAYVPFYLLVRAGLPALLIASILAVAQSIILWLTFELGMLVSPSDDRRSRLTVGICAAALAFVNPILLQQFGSSFADITTGELALAGWLLLAQAVRTPSSGRVIGAGLFLGAAVALKLTNAVHAVAGFAVLIMLPLNFGSRVRNWVYFGVSLGLGFAVVGAPWSFRLEQMFGNPIFPLANHVFRSPEFTAEPMRHLRFTPETLMEALSRPFAMVNPVNMVHEELRAPDIRYAVLVVLVAALSWHWTRRRLAQVPARSPKLPLPPPTRVLAALGCGFCADWILWLSGSGNGRYFLPAACVAGVLIAGTLFSLSAQHPKLRNYSLIALFGVQSIQLWMGTDFRWHAAAWGGQWFGVAVPAKLRVEPSLYFSIGGQSNSFIAPFLAKGSGLVNFAGGYEFGPEGKSGERIKALESRFGSHLRVLIRGEELHEDAERLAPRRSQVDIAVGRFGLRVDTSDCQTISVDGVPPELEVTIRNDKAVVPAARDKLVLLSCHLITGASNYNLSTGERDAANLALDRLEDACPKLFQPRRPLTAYDGKQWLRRYTNTDLAAWVSNGDVKFIQMERATRLGYLGREADWIKAPLPLDCGRHNGIYYAAVITRDRSPDDQSVQ
jgi:hypothetical protein